MNEIVVKPFEPDDLFAAIVRRLPVLADAAPAAQMPGDGAAAVSFELGLGRCLGRHDLYLRVIRRFLDTRQHDADKLRAAHAHARGDDEAMAHLAHTTISTAGTIGAARLSEIAGHLQESVRVGAAGELPTLIEAFARSHRNVVDELRAFAATR